MPRHSFRQRPPRSTAAIEVIFGRNPVLEVLRLAPDSIQKLWIARGADIGDRVLADARALSVVVEVVDRQALDAMTGQGHHQGVALQTKPFAFEAVEDLIRRAPPLVAVLDGIVDPQNLGAIVRAAEVLGAGGVVIPKDRSANVTPAVIRASSGAAVHLPIAQVVNLVRALEQLKEAGYWVVGLAADGASTFQELPSFERAALVVGNEGEGIRPLVGRACDFIVSIPVRGRVASLNAATAAAIGLHEIASRLSWPRQEPAV
jgi:23S rRNA (guanosine2251-2'-O)-methyltransferase